MNKVDVTIKWPFKWCLVGSSGSGKTNFSHQIVLNSAKIFDKSPERLLIIYKEHQNIYDRFRELVETEVVHEDEIDLESMTKNNKDRLLIICDDLYFSKKLEEVAEHFLVKGRHRNTSWLVLTQSIFNRPALRNISRNSTHITLFKTVRLNEPHIFFAQLRPRSSRVLQDIFTKATESSYSYLDIDLSQTCPDKLRYKSNLFDRAVTVFIIMDNTFRTMYLVSAADFDSQRNANFQLQVQNKDVCKDGMNISVKPVVKRQRIQNKTEVNDGEKEDGKQNSEEEEKGADRVNGGVYKDREAAIVKPPIGEVEHSSKQDDKDFTEKGDDIQTGQRLEASNHGEVINPEQSLSTNRKRKPEILSFDSELKKVKRFQPYPFLEANARKPLLVKNQVESNLIENLQPQTIQSDANKDENEAKEEKDDTVDNAKQEKVVKISDDQWIKGLKSRLTDRKAQYKRKRDTLGVRIVDDDKKKSLIHPKDFHFLNEEQSSQFMDTWKPLKEMSNKKVKINENKRFRTYSYYIK